MTELVPEARLIPVYLPDWGITAPLAQVDASGPVYVVVRLMCAELGISGIGSQLEKLNTTYEEGSTALVDLRIPRDPGGRQVMTCLRKAEAALWIVGIHPRKVKEQFRGHLEEIKRDVLAAADRIVWGDHTGVLTVSSAPAPGGHLRMGPCPLCRAELQAYFTPDKGYGLEPVPESD